MAKKAKEAEVHDEPLDEETLDVIELDGNLADAEKPKELTPGPYIGEIQDVQAKTSEKGNRYYNIKFVIPPEEIPADLADHFEDGAMMFYNRVIVPRGSSDRRALWNLRKFIEAIGLDPKTTTIDPNEWMGCKAKLRVVIGKYQGEPRAEIKSVEAAEARVKGRAVEEEEEDEKPVRAARRR